MSPLPDGIIRTPDGVFVLRDDTHLSRHIERWFRLDIEYQFLHELAPYVPEGGVVIDAGACLGDHALTWSQMVGATGKVFCFEPHPLTFQALRLNMDRLVNVACLNCALGDRNAELPFQRDPNIGASYMAAVGTEKVWVDTLDNLPQVVGQYSLEPSFQYPVAMQANLYIGGAPVAGGGRIVLYYV